MSAVNTPAAFAFDVAAPRVEWAEKIKVSIPACSLTLLSQWPIIAGFTAQCGILTEMKSVVSLGSRRSFVLRRYE